MSSSSRVNRGNPALHSHATLSAHSMRQSQQRTGSGSVSGYGGGRGPADWTSGSPASARVAAAIKQQQHQSNPYAPGGGGYGGGGGGPSPWSTPSSSGGGGGRYKHRGSNSSTARSLFNERSEYGGGGGGGKKSAAAASWEDQSNDAASHAGSDASLLADDSASTSSLLRATTHPESWESYDAGVVGSSPSHASPSPIEPASLSQTPVDSPGLGAVKLTSAGEQLLVDKLASLDDVTLSSISSGAGGKKEEGPNEVALHMLSLLYDPPVQGCELKPYVSIVDGFGRVSAVTTDESAASLDFRWFRGQKRLCANVARNCTKAATMQCLSCAKLGAAIVPPHLSYFCSDKCLKDNWPQHKQVHAQHKRERNEWFYDEEEADDTSQQQQQLTAGNAADSARTLYCKYPGMLANTWQEVCTDRAYTPSGEDVGRCMRLECAPLLKAPRDAAAAAPAVGGVASTSLHTGGLNLGQVVRIDTSAVIPTPLPPPPRTLLFSDPNAATINQANTFRCVCYNVLAQIYATRQMYPYTAIWALQWEYRKNLLLREIVSHHADVICLQEVQSNHFETFFQPQLSKHGYDGVFKRKTRDAGVDSAGNQMIDGCATFFKRDRFALIEQYGIEFSEAARQHTANRLQLRRLLRGNVALVLVLEELTPPPTGTAAARRNRKRRLCVANTHIFWDPEYSDVKLWQTWVLCQELEKLVLPRNLPLVLCGDFNSLADSSVYELLSTERVEQGEDVFGAAGDPTGLLPPPHQLSHRLPLLSAYSAIGEPKYTNYTGSFVGVLDYVFYTRTHLRCVACLDVDDESLLRQHTALPSPHYASDHIALVTTLEFIDP